MDYSQAAYFAGAQAPYHQFPINIPPLTPSHSNSAGSEDFNTTSPPDAFDHYPSEQFQNFDQYAAQFNPPPAFPGPPTPPNQHPAVHNGQPHSHRAINGAATAAAKPSQADALPLSTKPEPVPDLDAGRQGSNSAEEDDLTPAQSRRKAQNRAAQRAFRERKERHVKDLEAKLASLEAAQHETASENEKLKRDLQKMSTENEILKATSSLNGGHSPGHAAAAVTTGPLQYNPTDFYTNVLSQHPNKTPSHRIVTSDSGERLYAAGATWDYIISHDMYKRGLVDIADISNRLKHLAKCDGQGPVFEEKAILEAIEESVASGSDELL
ncbi:AP-1-like transcription factor [Diaporthe australafricana]|uniref:AP-1-like transcription factor n=1 Tax=Diaporthe australafricana TaxID=127596 RepID=A0ABR3WE25_9PEZI